MYQSQAIATIVAKETEITLLKWKDKLFSNYPVSYVNKQFAKNMSIVEVLIEFKVSIMIVSVNFLILSKQLCEKHFILTSQYSVTIQKNSPSIKLSRNFTMFG